MALVTGTNCGLVSSAPTSDPTETGGGTEGYAVAMKVTTGVGVTKITELGWYLSTTVGSALTYEVGVYEDDAGDGEPGALVGKSSATSAGTDEGWKSVSVDISVSASTTYWLALQVDYVSGTGQVDYEDDTGEERDYKGTEDQTTLTNPWGDSAADGVDRSLAVYGVYSTGEINPKIKAAGTFSTKPIKYKASGTFAEKTMKVKVSGTFK